MIKLKNILTEEIYNNKATVYHRTKSHQLLTSLLMDGFKHGSGMYGEGIYTTYEPTNSTEWTPTPEDPNPEGRENYYNYGMFQVKFSVDLINFFIFDWEVYQKVKYHVAKIEKFTKQKSDQNNFINLQAEYFKLPHRINTPYKKRYTSELALEFGFNEDYKLSNNPLINGIVFFGSRDGSVLVCYNKAMIVPISMSHNHSPESINLQKILDSNMKLKNQFKDYFKKFIKSKNAAMSNVELTKFDIEKEKWTYNETTKMYSYYGNVQVTDEIIKNGKLVIKFDKVGGSFSCDKKMISLEGCPREVGGNFYCYGTNISSLKGAPLEVGGHFYCSNTNITSLEGCPQEVGDSFFCDNTNISSLKGAPLEIRGDFNCQRTKITSLKYSPQKIGGSFDCSRTLITSLKGGPRIVHGMFGCYFTNITSLEGAPEVVGDDFYCNNTKITSLKGAPAKVGMSFDCEACDELNSLEYLPIARRYYVPDHLKDELHLMHGD